MSPVPTGMQARTHPCLLITTALCLALTLGPAGCSSNDPDAAAIDPCSLLTTDQIETTTGWSVQEGTRPETAPRTAGAICNWDDGTGEGAVHLQVHDGAAAKLLDERRRSLERRGATRAPRTVTLEGASEAFDVEAEGLLAMAVGDDYVQLSVIGGAAEPDHHRRLGAQVAHALR